ncbi:unnamed protein product [Ectocarpus fasciculatus]
MASQRHQRHRRCPTLVFLVAMSLTRLSTSFAPPLAARGSSGGAVRPLCGVTSSSRSPLRCLKHTSSPTAPRAAAEAAGDHDHDRGSADDDDGIDELVGIDEFRANKAERDRVEEQVEDGRRAAVEAAAAAVAGVGKGVGLGLEGAIFPNDAFPGSPGTEEITLQDMKLENGQPEAMVGFWKLYGSTGDGEDLSGRVILRADGQVVGGPTVRKTPGVEWSDPEGLQPVGGRWAIYSDKRTGRARLRFTIVLSFQAEQQLEMDGTVLMVDGMGETGGLRSEGSDTDRGGAVELGGEPKPQVFGGVFKRNGEVMDAGEGDFSMMKVPAGEDKLVATVGSQQKRFW